MSIPVKIQNLNELIHQSTKEIAKTNKESQIQTANLIKQIEGINIPQRLDKLDATVAGITQSIQTLIQRFEPLERNLKEGQHNKASEIMNHLKQIKSRNEEVLNQLFENSINVLNEKIEISQTKLNAEIQSVQKENRLIKILLYVLVGVLAVSIIVQFI